MTHRTLSQILAELTVLNIVFFSCIVVEWNSLQTSPSVRVFHKEGGTYLGKNLGGGLHIFFTKHRVQIPLFIANTHSLHDAKDPLPCCKIWYLFRRIVLSFSSLSFSRCLVFFVASLAHFFSRFFSLMCFIKLSSNPLSDCW